MLVFIVYVHYVTPQHTFFNPCFLHHGMRNSTMTPFPLDLMVCPSLSRLVFHNLWKVFTLDAPVGALVHNKSAIWPCNPENVLVAHKPDTMEIIR